MKNERGDTMVGERLKRLRKSKGLKQKELAEIVYVSPSAVSQYENGRSQPSRETLEELARCFGVTVDYLLGYSPSPNLEEKMNSIYYDNVTVAALLEKCDGVPQDKRGALLTMVDALAMDPDAQGKR